MKKIISVILCMVVVLFSLCSCGKEETKKTDGKLNIVATIFPPYDFAKNAGGDFVNVSMLLKPGMESHSYDPTPDCHDGYSRYCCGRNRGGHGKR